MRREQGGRSDAEWERDHREEPAVQTARTEDGSRAGERQGRRGEGRRERQREKSA